MNEIQPSFFQWRKKVTGALAMSPKSLTLLFTAPDGRVCSIEPEELQTPQQGTYTAKITDGSGNEQEFTSDYELPTDRPVRRTPEDAFIARYERMADDLERARRSAEARAQAAEHDKFAALEVVGGQQKRIFELEQRVAELEAQSEPLFDDDTAGLVLQLIDQWTGAAELRARVLKLLQVIEEDPRVADKIVRRAPQIIADLLKHVHENAAEE